MSLQTAADVDPLDPYAKQKLARIAARDEKAKKQAAKKEREEVEQQQQQEKDKPEKGKGKKPKDEPSVSRPPVRKVWYEARTKGCPYSYYWNIDTNGI